MMRGERHNTAGQESALLTAYCGVEIISEERPEALRRVDS